MANRWRTRPGTEGAGLHDAPVHQPEVPRVDRHVHVGDPPEQPVEALCRPAHETAALAVGTLAVHDVKSLPPLPDEVADQLGRVLEVTVQQDHRVAGGDPHSAREGALGAEGPGMRDHDDPGIALGQTAQDLTAVVRTTVVHEDDLVVHPDLREDRGETLVHDRDGARVEVARDDRADALAPESRSSI